jgi:hypothetical protein
MARTTMTVLISELRGLTNAGTADYSIAGVDYWSGNQLEAILDANRIDLYREGLFMVPRHVSGGDVEYYEHLSRWNNYEETDGGTAVFVIEDAQGNDQGTALWSADYLNGKITFVSDTAGITYYLTGRSYDLYGAAAEVWRRKSSQIAAGASGFDWSSDNMSVRRSQQVTQAKDMTNYYSGLARIKTTTIYRSDTSDHALD